MDATADVIPGGSRLLIPRNYRILEKASNERAGFAKGIRVVKGGGQKSRVNPCKSKLSPASSCTAPRIISFSLRIQLISAPRSLSPETLQNLTMSKLPYLFRFVMSTLHSTTFYLDRVFHNFSPSVKPVKFTFRNFLLLRE